MRSDVSVRRAIEKAAAAGALPSDTPDEKLRKSALVAASLLIATCSFVWVGSYAALGLWRSALIPAVYQMASLAGLAFLAKTKRYELYRASQLAMILLLPFLLQWSLGGFANGSAVAVWAGITPVLAYLFGARGGVWLLSFVLLLAGSAAAETTLAAHAPHIDSGVRAALWVMNPAGHVDVDDLRAGRGRGAASARGAPRPPVAEMVTGRGSERTYQNTAPASTRTASAATPARCRPRNGPSCS